MDENLKLIKKIHEDMDETCYASILTDWKKSRMVQEKRAEEIFELTCDGLSISDIAKHCNINLSECITMLDEYKSRYCNNYDNSFYDRSFTPDMLYKFCEDLILSKQSDAYFSINSFYRRKRKNDNVRHINAIVLDFDFYKIEEYKDMTPSYFFEKVIQRRLKKEPTAVIDSGRGLYVIYAFHHCSYHMDRLYHSILNQYAKEYERYGIDPAAMLTSQVIRIPGTINSKTGQPVQILSYTETDYRIQDFAKDLPCSAEEVKNWRINGKKKKQKNKTPDLEKLAKRKPYFKDYYEDFKKLILIRNKSDKYLEEGYRELLLYLTREKACWMGYTIDESIRMAKKLNEMFNVPLTEKEVELNCKPSDHRLPCSIDTMIDKLSITIEEQKQMRVLKRRYMKKAAYARRNRLIKLLNRTDKQHHVLERRARVCELKYTKHFSNKRIAEIVGVNKSTITRDLQYIKNNPSKFAQKLSEYLSVVKAFKQSEEFRRKMLYKKQQQLLEWLKIAHTALDYLVRKLGVAKN